MMERYLCPTCYNRDNCYGCVRRGCFPYPRVPPVPSPAPPCGDDPCPKCGSADVRLDWQSRGALGDGLKNTCRRCNYSWTTPCKDAGGKG